MSYLLCDLDRLKPYELGFELGIAVFEEHLNHLAEVLLELVAPSRCF